MKTFHAALLSSCLFFAVPGMAQESNADKTSHDFALSKVSGLMYVRGMSQQCPFEKNLADTFEIVEMVVAAGIPPLPKEEIEAAARDAKARVDRDIADSKEESCRKAQAVVQATVEEIAAMQKRKKQ